MSKRGGLVWGLQRVVGPAVAVCSFFLHMHLGLDWTDSVYESIKIFLLDADTSLGADQVINPWLYGGLWLVRGLAPVVTAAAFVEVLLYFGIFGLVPYHWSGHVIVVGAGRIGSEFGRSLLHAGRKVVIVDNDPDNPNLDALRRAGAKVVIGDANEETLKLAKFQKARHLIATTPNDVLNLNITTIASGHSGQSLTCICHVYDLRLMQDLSKLFERNKSIHPFNVYQLAAEAIAEEIQLEPGALVVIAGFGRFGRSILRSLVAANGAQVRYRVVDSHMSQERFTRIVQAEMKLGLPDSLEFVQNDILDPNLWKNDLQIEGDPSSRAVVVVCTDNDMSNLVCGLELRSNPAIGEIHIRLFKHVSLLKELELDSGAGGEASLEGVLVWEKMLAGFHSRPEFAALGLLDDHNGSNKTGGPEESAGGCS